MFVVSGEKQLVLRERLTKKRWVGAGPQKGYKATYIDGISNSSVSVNFSLFLLRDRHLSMLPLGIVAPRRKTLDARGLMIIWTDMILGLPCYAVANQYR
jgi:hypothetical protein